MILWFWFLHDPQSSYPLPCLSTLQWPCRAEEGCFPFLVGEKQICENFFQPDYRCSFLCCSRLPNSVILLSLCFSFEQSILKEPVMRKMLIKTFFIVLVLFCPLYYYITFLWPCKPLPQCNAPSGHSVFKEYGLSPFCLKMDLGLVSFSTVLWQCSEWHSAHWWFLSAPSGKILTFCSVARTKAPFSVVSLDLPSFHCTCTWYLTVVCE